MMKKPEILAPAGSIEALKAAVHAGCDAVYIGGSRFGARAYAENPGEEEMLSAIRYCHLHGVKIYMTVNTLLKNAELEGLYEFLAPFYEAGLDAVLVQDMGVLSLVNEWFPDLAIHASTQMTITQGKTADFLKPYHVTRIVPARELTLRELRQMRQDTDVEIEVFVHGALCYCYSGQCLFSSMLGGRSGNRGRCAQPCRQLYQWQGKGKQEKGYLLSPKELCNLSYLPELIEAGMDSLKIEGRMKRREYVAFVTGIYRKYVDLYCSMGKERYLSYLGAHLEEWETDLRNLSELYNREGFTQGYLSGEAGDTETRRPGTKGTMSAGKRPNHGGVLVGRILSARKREVVYEAVRDIGVQDVVEFRDEKWHSLYEYTVGQAVSKGAKVTAKYKSEDKIPAGAYVYRTKNAALLAEVKERWIERKMQIPVCGRFRAVYGEEAVLTVEEGENQITVSGETCKKAEKQTAVEESVRKVLMQTGESDFYFDHLEIFLEDDLFLNVGMLKKLRRAAFAELERKIIEKSGRKRHAARIEEKKHGKAAGKIGLSAGNGGKMEGDKKRMEFSASVMNIEQLKAVLRERKISRIYLQTEEMDFGTIGKAFNLIKECGKSPWLAFPFIFRTGVEKIFQAEKQRKEGIFSLSWDGFLLKNMESLFFARQMERTPKLAFDTGFSVMNDKAYEFWKKEAFLFTASLELTWEEMKQTSFLSACELTGYGRIPLMVSAQCVQANTESCICKEKKPYGKKAAFQDGKKRMFSSVCYCRYCYNVIYEEKPVYLWEVLEKKEEYPVRSFRYAFTTEKETEVEEVLSGKPPFQTQKGHFYKGIW